MRSRYKEERTEQLGCRGVKYIARRYGFLITAGGIIAVIVITIWSHVSERKRLMELEAGQKQITEQIRAAKEETAEQINRHTEFLLEAGMAAAQAIGDEIAGGTEATGRRINATNERIRQINAVYAGILSEMEKRTLDSLYSETVLMETEEEAKALFREGRYAQAGIKYAVVSEGQPENIEARFYYLYSIFLNNKIDRSNYGRIKEGFQALERSGYIRAEIREALEYIEAEEEGIEAEAGE